MVYRVVRIDLHERDSGTHQTRGLGRALRVQREGARRNEDRPLTERDVVESILNAIAIYKTLRSTSPLRRHAAEKLYVIQSVNMDGLPIYTKGKLTTAGGVETYYFLISSKRAT